MHRRLNDRERKMWVMNDEGLYHWWKDTRKCITTFIRENRNLLDECIIGALNEKPRDSSY